MINRVKIIGFMSAHGYSRKNSSNFEMNKIYVMQLIEKKNTPNFSVVACGGYEITDLDIDDNIELYKKLESFSFPCEAELSIGMKLRGNRTVGVVTDVNLI